MSVDGNTSRLVERIYEAAMYPDSWGTVLLDLAMHFNSGTAGMWVHTSDAASRVSKMVGVIDDAEMSFYNQNLAENNPWYQVPGLMRPGCALTDTSLEILHQDRSAFTRTEFYQEWIRKLGLRHVLGGTLTDTAGNDLNFTFLRNARAGEYLEREIAEFRVLSRHVAKAIELSRQIDARRWTHKLGESSLNQLGIGLVIVDASCRLLFANAKAESLLRTGTVISLRNSRVVASRSEDQEALENVIRKLMTSSGHSRIDIRTAAAAAVTLHFSSHVDTDSFLSTSRRAVTIFIIEALSGSDCRADVFKTLWQLSNKEAQFAELLLQGFSVKEISEKLSMTFETTRWYCKQVMRKMGVTRQSQLVAKLMRSAMVSFDAGTSGIR